MSDSARAQLAVGVAARDLSDDARGIAATVTIPQPATERLRTVRRLLRTQSLVVLDLTVIQVLTEGASWSEVAEGLGLPVAEVVSRYADLVDEFRHAAADPAHVAPTETSPGTASDPDPAGTAESLDTWLDRHLDPWDERGPRLGAILT